MVSCMYIKYFVYFEFFMCLVLLMCIIYVGCYAVRNGIGKFYAWIFSVAKEIFDRVVQVYNLLNF